MVWLTVGCWFVGALFPLQQGGSGVCPSLQKKAEGLFRSALRMTSQKGRLVPVCRSYRLGRKAVTLFRAAEEKLRKTSF